MPMYTGIALGREIRSKNSKAEIVYFTSSPEFAIDAFSVKASHYILKPYSKEQFFEAMDRSVTNILAKQTKYISLTTKNGELYRLDICEICCVESQGHDINIYTGEQEVITVKTSLNDLLAKLDSLSPAQFISPYKGYIVNFHKVRWISKDGITLKCKTKVPIPKRNYKQLQKQFQDYMFGGNGK